MIRRNILHGIVIAGLLALCLLIAGCTSQPVESVERFAFTEADNNKAVTLPVGSEIVISLDENPTTGYSWNLTSTRGLQYVSDTFIPPKTQLVGAGGVHVWQYRAAEKGSAEFSAINIRPWEETPISEGTFSMTFTIE
ncbi:MAG: protease inhibitor I42 family protein [Methanomicrobiales archaeon]|nr:protease inhibitor I42 family protein [Methanomicrobiales archaeon]